MADDFANKLDEAAEGIIEFVVRLLRTVILVIFNWSALTKEILKEERTEIVGPRVFLVASVLLVGIVGKLDAAFWGEDGAVQWDVVMNYLADLANVKLKDALIRSAPFFVVALLASSAIRAAGPGHPKLRDVVQYAMAGVCLLFYPTLFLAAFLISAVFSTLAGIIATLGGFLLALLFSFVMRLRSSAVKILENDPADPPAESNGFMLAVIYSSVLIATMFLLILRLFVEF